MDKKLSNRSLSEDSGGKSASARKMDDLGENPTEIEQKLASLKFTTKKRMRDSERKLWRPEESSSREKKDQELEIPGTVKFYKGRPIVLATHLVPSLPIDLFQTLAEAIEAATNKQVVILYESKLERAVAEEIVDIAILPAGKEWPNGNLMPISFVFEHKNNRNFSPGIFADVVVAADRAPQVETLMDLRGHRCALPDRDRLEHGVTRLLFNYLHSKGEGPSFFGNTLDADSQLAALHMVTGKQVELCVLESPVIKYHRKYLPEAYSLHILISMGPIPPYQIMTNKTMEGEVANKIQEFLLTVNDRADWLEKFTPFSVLGFAKYTKNVFENDNMKFVATTAPYY